MLMWKCLPSRSGSRGHSLERRARCPDDTICRDGTGSFVRSVRDAGMRRGHRVLIAVGLLAAGAASATWAAFLISQGLERPQMVKCRIIFGIVGFGIAGLVVSLRGQSEASTSQPVQPSASTGTDAVADRRTDPSAIAGRPPAETKPSGGSVFNIDADTAYTAHEMTVYNDGPDKRKRQG